tara:strand:- start:59 stop:886 length:828 start_codon:yes stop_codon:yes gene_type:complete
MPKLREDSKMYLKVSCKKCNKEWYKLKYDIKRWKSGMCLECTSLLGLSKVKVLKGVEHPLYIEPIKCEDCFKQIKVRGKRLLMQKKCAVCYNKSRENKSYCKRCGIKLLHNTTTYCAKCFPETRKGENSTSWKGGVPNCILCCGKLSTYKSKSEKHTGICKKCLKGENSKRWNKELTEKDREPFRTKMPQYYEWRKLVFNRDCYCCQKCGDNKGGNLCSHHIENYSSNKEKRFDVGNGITLCERCHINFHKKYGWKSNTQEQINDYIILQEHLIF